MNQYEVKKLFEVRRDVERLKRDVRELRAGLIFLAVIMLGLLFFVGRASAAESLNRGDVLREVAWEVLHVIDWGQTRDIAQREGEGYYEAGPARVFIGEHPSVGEVDRYMVVGALVHPVITRLLPRQAALWGVRFAPREMWQWVSIGVSAGCVARNVSIGLRVNF